MYNMSKTIVYYKEYVTVKDIVTGDNGKCRYLAEYNLKISENDTDNINKVAAVLLKNPSKADKEKSDQTINVVLKYMRKFMYSKIYVVNLIPIYATNSSSIDKDHWSNDCILNKNMYYIKKAIREADKLFVGWGGNFKLDAAVVKSQIARVASYASEVGKKMYCYEINKSNKQPRHPCRNGWNEDKAEESFKEFHVGVE